MLHVQLLYINASSYLHQSKLRMQCMQYFNVLLQRFFTSAPNSYIRVLLFFDHLRIPVARCSTFRYLAYFEIQITLSCAYRLTIFASNYNKCA